MTDTDTVTLYTGTQYGQTINLWGETVTFSKEGQAEVSQKTAVKASNSVPDDYSLNSTPNRVVTPTRFERQPSGDGIGVKAASVAKKEAEEEAAKAKAKMLEEQEAIAVAKRRKLKDEEDERNMALAAEKAAKKIASKAPSQKAPKKVTPKKVTPKEAPKAEAKEDKDSNDWE